MIATSTHQLWAIVALALFIAGGLMAAVIKSWIVVLVAVGGIILAALALKL